MLPRGRRNTGTYLLEIPVRASPLAEAHLPLDRRTLGVWTASVLLSNSTNRRALGVLTAVQALARHLSDDVAA